MGNAFEEREGILNQALRKNEGDAKKVLSDPPLRDRLYASGILEAFNIRALAQLWLEELTTTGLQQMDRTSGAPLKEHRQPTEPSIVPSGDGVYPARLEDSGQVLWVNLNGKRADQDDYRTIEVLDQPTRTDKALFAALTALEVKDPTIDTKRLREVLP